VGRYGPEIVLLDDGRLGVTGDVTVTPVTTSAAVPEPSAGLLLVLGMMLAAVAMAKPLSLR
jgi:hypothetical protein